MPYIHIHAYHVRFKRDCKSQIPSNLKLYHNTQCKQMTEVISITNLEQKADTIEKSSQFKMFKQEKNPVLLKILQHKCEFLDT